MSLCDFIKFYVLAFGSHYGKGLGRSALNNPHLLHSNYNILLFR